MNKKTLYKTTLEKQLYENYNIKYKSMSHHNKKFLDQVKIFVKAGNGGKGCVSFRREKYIPKGGPNGGNGGYGGSIIIKVDSSLNSLLSFIGRVHFKAKHGQGGQGKLRNGACADNMTLLVPKGTIIRSLTDDFQYELVRDNEEIIVAKGGKGGIGNGHLCSSINQAPIYSLPPTDGEERWLSLTLKIFADIGLIGMPNVGKSSLINVLTNCKSKVGNFDFTTLEPRIGTFHNEDENNKKKVQIADIPGLVENSAQGKGKGFQFLKHIERTSILMFVLDAKECREQYKILINEVKAFNETILQKEKVIIFNKIDLIPPHEIENIKKYFANETKYMFFSSIINNKGINSIKLFLNSLSLA